jgi:AraC-like DNA-binding protein
MDGRAVRALAFMMERSNCESLSIKEVAREVGLSEWYLQRLLKVATGLTFRHQLRQMRVNAAQTLLMDKTMSIKEVAFAVGYRTTSILDRNFRAVVGMCPADYRVARFSQRSHEIASKRS